MTLTELIMKAEQVGRRFNSSWIPLKLNGKDVEIDLEPNHNDSDWVVNIRIVKK